MEGAVLFEEPGHSGAVAAHAAGDGDLVALGALIELDGHILHLEGLVGHLEAGAHQLCQIGVHIHRGDEQLVGVRVGVVIVKAALRLLDAVDAAPHGRLPQRQVVDVLHALKRHGVKEDEALQLILVFLPLGGIVKELGHGFHAPAQYGRCADEHQNHDEQAQCLPSAAAVEPGVFFRGHRCFHRLHRLQRCFIFVGARVLARAPLPSIPHSAPERKTRAVEFL